MFFNKNKSVELQNRNFYIKISLLFNDILAKLREVSEHKHYEQEIVSLSQELAELLNIDPNHSITKILSQTEDFLNAEHLYKKYFKYAMEAQILKDGIHVASARIATILIEKIEDRTEAKNFILEELDAASKGNDVAVKFVATSGFQKHEYHNAMQNTNWGNDEKMEELQLTLRSITGTLSDEDFMCELNLAVVDKIMFYWKLGKYEKNIIRQLDK